LILCACLAMFIGTLVGCHAEAKTNDDHGVETTVK
jgi:hypothetical protein